MSDSSNDRGFVRVGCTQCNDDNVWFTCNTCNKSDHFLFSGGVASCECGATYDHGTCTCGATVQASDLSFVPFEKGPMALADLEYAWGRMALIAAVLLGLFAAGVLFGLR